MNITAKITLAAVLLFIGGCVFVAKTPEPNWQSIKTDGNIEIRQYDMMIVAEAETSGERYAAINDGFRILAGYIFGGNTKSQDIAMTAPVTQQSDRAISAQGSKQGAKITMTAPVTQEAVKGEGGGDSTWKVRFVMPEEYTLDTLPQPNDKRIKLVKIPAFQVAVIRFSGFNRDKNLSKHELELETWIQQNHLKQTGSATYAFYDPPWTLPFLKRNEVMIPIQE